MTMLGVLAQTGAVEVTSGAAEFWIFWLIAPLSLAAAVSVILLKNPVHAALMLVVNFFTFAVFYAILQGQFLATIQVIVYAGAIMILFLFVLMLLGVDRAGEQGPGRLRGQKVAAIALGLVLFGSLTGAVAGPYMGIDSSCNRSAQVTDAITDAGADARPCQGLESVNAADGGNVEGIGRLLFTTYVWPFEVTSVLLVVAAIGAMVLGRRNESLSELVDQGAAAEPSHVTPAMAMVEAATGQVGASATGGLRSADDLIAQFDGTVDPLPEGVDDPLLDDERDDDVDEPPDADADADDEPEPEDPDGPAETEEEPS